VETAEIVVIASGRAHVAARDRDPVPNQAKAARTATAVPQMVNTDGAAGAEAAIAVVAEVVVVPAAAAATRVNRPFSDISKTRASSPGFLFLTQRQASALLWWNRLSEQVVPSSFAKHV
jgi:hypothetical protein